MSQDLIKHELLKAQQAAHADTKDSGKAAKRVEYLELVIRQGGELHSDGFIRYPDRPTLLGYE